MRTTRKCAAIDGLLWELGRFRYEKGEAGDIVVGNLTKRDERVKLVAKALTKLTEEEVRELKVLVKWVVKNPKKEDE